MDRTGMGEKPVEDAKRRYGDSVVEGVLFSLASKLDIATAMRGRYEDRTIRIPAGDRALRADLHAIRKVVGLTGAPRLLADDDTDGHADRFWAGALACAAADLGGPFTGTADGRVSAAIAAERGLIVSPNHTSIQPAWIVDAMDAAQA